MAERAVFIKFGAHKHVSSAQMVYEGVSKHRFPVAYIRSGTCKGIGKIHDQWAVGRYGAGGEPTGQSVTLWPGKKRMDVHLEFDTGILAHQCHYVGEYVRRANDSRTPKS